ncbi:MAG: hypothetical protein EA339_06495 [Rhodobacteraceae bacterium]|nr:MAG: hypothetical protein EA339_06495 [Paracoccaceae bacterium]
MTLPPFVYAIWPHSPLPLGPMARQWLIRLFSQAPTLLRTGIWWIGSTTNLIGLLHDKLLP